MRQLVLDHDAPFASEAIRFEVGLVLIAAVIAAVIAALVAMALINRFWPR
jgi:hypothetical protein